MKKLLLLTAFSVFALNSWAQTLDFKGEKCGSAVIHNYMMATDENYRQSHEIREQNLQQIIQENKALQSRGAAGPIYTIPVVVHIMHLGTPVGGGTTAGNPGENISDEQVRSAIDALNRDFRKKAGTIGDGLGVDSEIEFALATKGPSGESYPGGAILRVNASGTSDYATNGITNNAGSTNNEASIKALSRWDKNKYYNIWIVYKIDGSNQGGTQGYAYFPGASSNVDGSVILFNAFGTTGVLKSYTNKNRTATHEIGHGLSLYHTFNGDNPSGDGSTIVCPTESNCSTEGDRICDIPPHKRTNSNCPADNTANSCKSGTTAIQYIHNYMDYSSDACQNTFTQDQVNRMRATFNTGGGRNTLVTPANNDATGTNGQNKPYAQAVIQNTKPCFGVPVSFSDNSLYAPTSWKWTFTGGTPSTSTDQNPSTTFNGAGSFTVKLVATNQYGSDSTTYVDTIKPIASKTLPLSYDFETGVFPNTELTRSTDWENRYSAQYNDTTWKKISGLSAFVIGTSCLVLPNTEAAVTTQKEIWVQTPPVDISNIAKPQLFFDLAYKRNYNPAPSDSLVVSYSTDCGNTFTRTSYQKHPGNLFTVNATGQAYSVFTPTSNQWRTDSVLIPTSENNKSVILRIGRLGTYEPQNALYMASNYLYLDNIKVRESGPPVANYTMSKTVICEGSSVTFTDSSKGSVDTYTWNFGTGASPATATGVGPHTVTYSGSGAKTVSLTVSGSYGNDTETKQTLEVKATPQTSPISGKSVVCSNDGELTYSVTNNSGSIYDWTVPAGAQIIGNNMGNSIKVKFNGNQGTISVQEIGLGNCPATPVSKQITIAQAPAAVTGGNKSLCVGDSVNIGAAAVQGNVYQWTPSNNTLTSASASNPKAYPTSTTKYYLTETNPSNGCTKTDSITLTVNPKPAANAGQSASVCAGTPVTLGASPVQGSTYSWSPSAGLDNPNSSSPSATVFNNTLFTLTETITATGCTKSNTVSINILPSPKAETGADQSVCAGTSAQLGANPVNNHTYAWSPSTGLNNSGISNPVASPSSTTTYTLTETNTDNGCKLSKSVTVTINALPSLNTTGDKTICSGASTSIGETSQSGFTYKWTPNNALSSATVASPNANPTATTQYKVEKKNSTTGCTNSAMVKVTVNPVPEAYTGGDQTSCQGQSIKLGKPAVSGSTYQWSGGSTATTSEITVSPVTATTYTLTETITATGCTKSNSSTVTPTSVGTVNTSVTASQKTTKVCAGGNVTFEASTSTGGSTPQYQWFKNGNQVSGATASTFTTSNVVNGDVIKVQMVSSLQCKNIANEPANSNNVTVTGVKAVFAKPSILGSPNTCIGSNYTFVAKTDTQGAMYTWSGPNSFAEFTDTIRFNNITTNKAGTYSVYYSKDGCQSPVENITIVVNQKPEAKVANNQVFCDGQTIKIGAASVSGNTYNWQPPTNLDNATSSNPTASPTATVTYTLVENNPTTGCSNTNSITLTERAPITANAGGDKTICDGSQVEIGTAPEAGFSYEWLVNGNVVGNTSKITVNPSSTTTYTLKKIDQGNANCFGTDEVVVNVNSNPSAAISSPSTSVCQGGSLELTASEAASYVWSTGATTQKITVTDGGTYTVELTSAQGCKSSKSISITSIGQPNAGSLALNPNEVCKGGASVVNTTNKVGSLTWQKSSDNITFQTISGATDTFISISDIQQSTYVRVLALASGCKTDTSIAKQITVKASAVAGTINTTKDTICAGQTATLNLVGSTGTIVWQSSADNTNFANISGASTSTYTTPALNNGAYYRARLSQGTCPDAFTSSKQIVVNPIPLASFSASKTNVSKGETVIFTALDSLSGTTFSWDFGDGASSTLKNPSHAYSAAGSYSVSLVSIRKGCSATETKSNHISVTTVSVHNTGANTFTLFPNPASDFIQLKFEQTQNIQTIQVLDMAGRMVKDLEPNAAHQYSVYDIPAGTYRLMVRSKEASHNAIFIKY
jgi:PKD repeat protein